MFSGPLRPRGGLERWSGASVRPPRQHHELPEPGWRCDIRCALGVVEGVGEASPATVRALRSRYREIYHYVRRRSRSDADAEDVVQEVFLDAVRALEQLAPDSPPPLGWLYTVAQNRLVDRARRVARRREVIGEGTLELVAAPPPEYGWEIAGVLSSAIQQLPQQQREVVVLKLVHGLPFTEIAAKTDSNEGACRMRFMRGLDQLRALLEEQEVTP